MEEACYEDPAQFAEVCGLIYVSDEEPGIRRRRCGRGFTFLHPNGQIVKDRRTLERIRLLVIPPAWDEVWICPLDQGHLQATGRDDQGRKQYLYHTRWVHLRNEGKYGRLLDFGRALPKLRRQIRAHLNLSALSREKVLAAVVGLLDSTFIRIGNLQYSQQNNAFGLTTLRDRHVKIEGEQVRFEFQGKSGVQQTVSLANRQLARIVRECREVPGYRLFQYYDEAGERQAIESHDVNNYLREITRCGFTAKDFRTWGGSVTALQELQHREVPDSEAALNKELIEVIDAVAERLGNTRAVCRQYYIHPSLFTAYRERWFPEMHRRTAGRRRKVASSHELSLEEQTLMRIMRRYHCEQITTAVEA